MTSARPKTKMAMGMITAEGSFMPASANPAMVSPPADPMTMPNPTIWWSFKCATNLPLTNVPARKLEDTPAKRNP